MKNLFIYPGLGPVLHYNGAKDSRVVAGSFFHLTNSEKIENIFSQSDVEKMV